MTEYINGKIKERGKVVKFSLAPLFFMYYNHIKYAISEKGKLCHIQHYIENGDHTPLTM